MLRYKYSSYSNTWSLLLHQRQTESPQYGSSKCTKSHCHPCIQLWTVAVFYLVTGITPHSLLGASFREVTRSENRRQKSVLVSLHLLHSHNNPFHMSCLAEKDHEASSDPFAPTASLAAFLSVYFFFALLSRSLTFEGLSQTDSTLCLQKRQGSKNSPSFPFTDSFCSLWNDASIRHTQETYRNETAWLLCNQLFVHTDDWARKEAGTAVTQSKMHLKHE